MAKKRDSYDWLLLLFLFLGLGKTIPAGRGGTPDPAPNRRPMDNMDDMMDGGSDGGGSSGGGGTSPNPTSPKNFVTTLMEFIGFTQGVPDKGKNIMPPNMATPFPPTYEMPLGLSAMVETIVHRKSMEGVARAEEQIELINRQKDMGIKLESGQIYVPNLGKGTGKKDPSITTTVWNPKTMRYDTYTNNPYTSKPVMEPMMMAPKMEVKSKTSSISLSESIRNTSKAMVTAPMVAIPPTMKKSYSVNLMESVRNTSMVNSKVASVRPSVPTASASMRQPTALEVAYGYGSQALNFGQQALEGVLKTLTTPQPLAKNQFFGIPVATPIPFPTSPIAVIP